MSENTPPLEIDGALVLEWAWSGKNPFGLVPGAEPPEIFGLAIATYDFKRFYRFSCDKDWNTVQDGLYDSVEEAKRMLPDQYKEVPAVWHPIDHGDVVYETYSQLLASSQTHLATSDRIETNDGDDEFVRIFIAGFLESATANDWGIETYKFICNARKGEFSEPALREFFEEHWHAFGMFHCLLTGYNLGLLATQKIDEDQFSVYEMLVYPFRDSKRDEIIAAFGES